MASSELRSRRRSIESARATGLAADPVIADSWQRCERDIDTHRVAAPVDSEPDEVRERWEASPIRRSGIGVEDQLARAAEAGGLIAAITDEDGRILWSSGSRQMRNAAEGVGFVPGGRWDEPSAGTNALGLALLTGAPSTVFSAEHWCESVQDWVCWSVPVRAPDGRRLGVLDLSGRWDTASPVAEMAVAALGRLVEEHLPGDVGTTAANTDQLELRLLGRLEVHLGGRRLALSPRQAELLAALALEGPSNLERLTDLVYGDHAVSPATVKAELSHLRRLLGGGIDSRPYRLVVPLKADVLDLRDKLHGGDLSGASQAYTGQLLPGSEAPFAIDHRHMIDVTLRRSLLESGSTAELLRYAEVHRFDEAVLEQAILVATPGDPLRHEAVARLENAQRA
ncbi:MAG: transcriptional regulator [Ilumatobacteraceae bacterium]|nr:transcriptional regulator [Ilumatobacteraceae bacterium]